MRFVALLLFIVIAARAAPAKKIKSPKAAEFEQSLGAPMRTSIVMPAFVIVPKTNFVYKRTFAWTYPLAELSAIKGFKLYIGQDSGSYTIAENTGTNWTGTNFIYTFMRTNWSERMERHFAVAVAVDLSDFESLPSNEIHWPAFPPDHYRLQWPGAWPSVNIYSHTDLRVPRASWPLLATVTGTNIFEGLLSDQFRFFVIDKPDVLSISVFNPNP